MFVCFIDENSINILKKKPIIVKRSSTEIYMIDGDLSTEPILSNTKNKWILVDLLSVFKISSFAVVNSEESL